MFKENDLYLYTERLNLEAASGGGMTDERGSEEQIKRTTKNDRLATERRRGRFSNSNHPWLVVNHR